MSLGYIMNTYPLVSTTFISREIAALERQGSIVQRYAARRWAGTLVDAQDKREAAQTQYLLDDRAGLMLGLLSEPFRAPRRFAQAFVLTLRLMANARGRAVKHIAYLAEAIALRRLALKDGVTHLHAHFSTNATAVAMLTHALGGPTYSFTVHGPDELVEPHRGSMREKVSRARFVACISQFARSEVMLSSDQADWGKLQIIHCGVSPANYGPKPHRKAGKHVLFVGRLAPVKGVSLLLQAIASAMIRHPDLKVTIIGDGPDRVQLEAQASALDLQDVVHFVGYQSQPAVADWMSDVDMLVLPSFAEGVPVVLMEAMASRLPVIATSVAGVPELVEDGVAGLVVPPGDLMALTNALDRLLTQDTLRASMGEAGTIKVRREFDVDQEAKKLRVLFSLSKGYVQERNWM